MDGAADSLDTPPPSGLKKVLSRPSRSQTSLGKDIDSAATSNRSNDTSPVDPSERRPATSAGVVTEDSPRRLAKLLGSRRRKKSGKISVDAAFGQNRNGKTSPPPEDVPGSGSSASGSQKALDKPSRPASLTDDSEPDRPPSLASRDSRKGLAATSSPLITTTIVVDDEDGASHTRGSSKSPSRRHSVSGSESAPQFLSVAPAATTPASAEFLSTSGSGKRGVSPARRLRDAFRPQSKKSPSVSPDRASSRSSSSRGHGLRRPSSRRSSLSEKLAAKREESPPPPLPEPIIVDSADADPLSTPPPRKPAEALTVSIQTPGDNRHVFAKEFTESPDSITGRNSESYPPGVVVSPSGNMISHRRVRSAEASVHSPTKLSHTTTLTPTSEESRTSAPRTPSANQSGFFSTVFSAAQNAASSISNSLGAQNKNRNGAQASESVDGAVDGAAQPVNGQAQKEPGSGSFDTDDPAGKIVETKDGVGIGRPGRSSSVTARNDELSARLEDQRAAKAVLMAFERSSQNSGSAATGTPEDSGIDAGPGASISRETSGDQTPSNGHPAEGETDGRKRAGSVRSRLGRRHRGSSATTASLVGAGLGMGSVSMSALATSAGASIPRLTGFAVASKKRNRDFHQLFRSVPEDDYLIDDYSCALQREIILAGRIYISEGHICFFSNILGWVTTLVISFDEIVAIEKESTAMVFPNAIAIQTQHARHTFRSLLSRDATYDLMINIWKINHPQLRSYVNGVRIDDGHGDKTEKADESDAGSESGDDVDEIYDEDEEEDVDAMDDGGDGSFVGSEAADSSHPLSRKGSGLGNGGQTSAPMAASMAAADKGDGNTGGNGGDAGDSFPGPATHAPTDFTDPSGRYEKVVKDDIVPAPLGKVYSMVFGPASGAFMSKFLVEDQKATDLQFEDDKKGLTNENKTRQYSYIKPLNSSIGPKQTKCISSETLDLLDLDKAVLVTLATQTPDVPSGNGFVVKTKYLFTWAANNHTRFLMTCTIEWSTKSWLKNAIEKGAIDGQTSFGNDLVRSLKAALSKPAAGAKTTKAGKVRRKKAGANGETAAAAAAAVANAKLEATRREAESWGVFAPLHRHLNAVVGVFKPFWNSYVAVGVIVLLLVVIYTNVLGSRGPAMLSSDVRYGGLTSSQRLAAYEEMWRHEETELWNWLEERVGIDGLNFPTGGNLQEPLARQLSRRQRQHSKDIASRLAEEHISDREMEHAIRITRERLDLLQRIVDERQKR